MKQAIRFLFFGMLLFFCSSGINTTASQALDCPPCSTKKEPIYQVSSLDSLAIGRFDGKTTYGRLKNFGDFGLGTFNAIDGEMIAVDGRFYQVKTDGKAYEVKKGLKTPFANVTHFNKDLQLQLNGNMTFSELQDYISTHLSDQNGYYAVRVEGDFEYVQTRSVHEQQRPYPGLSEVVANQVTFDFSNIEGTMVGFWFPEAVGTQNVNGFHFHFLTADRQAGGHLLDAKIKEGVIFIDRSTEIERIDRTEKK